MEFIKCQNCGKTDFKQTTIGRIIATEGHFTVNAYACQNCGHIDLFEPSLDSYAKYLRDKEEKKRKQEALKQQKKEEERKARIAELKKIIEDENSTVKQVREANAELQRLNSINSLMNGGIFG